MKYKLTTLPRGTAKLPVLDLGFASITLKQGAILAITPQTLNYLGNAQAALPVLDAAIALKPDLSVALINRAECLVRLHQYDSALIDFLKALELDGDSDYILGKCLHYKMKLCRTWVAQRPTQCAKCCSHSFKRCDKLCRCTTRMLPRNTTE